MADINSFRKIGRFRIFKPSEVLFMQNSLGDNMYIALRGIFGVYINTFTDFPVRVAGIPEGAFFGEMSVIDGSPRSATIISEELGMAISVEKEHFKTLLKNNPEIAAKILNTLSTRAESTAKMAREKGKDVSELPEDLKNPEQNPMTDLDNMIFFAARIRELNELLGVGSVKAEIEMKETVNTVTLLPAGHERFKEADEKDNSRILANNDYVCPYCRNGFKGKIPLFPRLKEKEKTIDQRIIYENFNILLYTNIVCPNCNFCDTYQEFSTEPLPLRKPKVSGNQFFNFEGFTGYSDEYKHTLDEALLSYYLNIECLKQIPNSGLRQGKAWLRLFWMYNDYEKTYPARNAGANAFNHYNKFLAQNKNKLTTEDFMTVNVILGELCMSLGDTKTAQKYFLENTNIGGFTTHDLAKKSLKRIADIKNI